MVVSVEFAPRDGSGLGIARCSEAPASLLVRRKNSWEEVDGPECESEHSESVAGNWEMLWDFEDLSILICLITFLSNILSSGWAFAESMSTNQTQK